MSTKTPSPSPSLNPAGYVLLLIDGKTGVPKVVLQVMGYYRRSGALIGTLLGVGLFAVGLARARADFLYADEFYRGAIVRINTDDGSASTFASGFNYPEGMALDHSGNLFVAEMTS